MEAFVNFVVVCIFICLQVPLSYLQLYDAVRKEAEKRAISHEPPILTSDELLQIAKNNPDNDICDTDELNQGKPHFLADFLPRIFIYRI